MSNDDRHATEPLTFSYQQTWGMVAAQSFRGLILLSPFFLLFVGVGLYTEIGSPGAPTELPPLWFCGVLFLGVTALLWLRITLEFALCSSNAWSLYVNEKTITRSCHSIFGTKDWAMRTDRVTAEAFDLELLDAPFCFDTASMQAFHFVAMYEDGKRLLFPCADKKQQAEWVRAIRQYLARTKEAA